MSNEEITPLIQFKRIKKYFLEAGLMELKLFLETSENNIVIGQYSEHETEIFQGILEQNLGEQDSSRQEFVKSRYEYEQSRMLINLYRRSFLTSLFSYMEIWLIRECYLHSKRINNESVFNETKGKGLERVKNYFSKVIKSTFPFGSSSDWLWIKNFQDLRDCIIHRNGSLTCFSSMNPKENLIKFIKSEKELELYGVNDNEIFIQYEFCMKALGVVHRLMLDILELSNL
jgi:hypothetical protein